MKYIFTLVEKSQSSVYFGYLKLESYFVLEKKKILDCWLISKDLANVLFHHWLIKYHPAETIIFGLQTPQEIDNK